MEKQLRGQVDFTPLNKAGDVTQKDFTAITFYNQGDVTAFVNDALKVAPGVSVEISQPHHTIIDETKYHVKFDVTDPASTGTNKYLLLITQKVYAR